MTFFFFLVLSLALATVAFSLVPAEIGFWKRWLVVGLSGLSYWAWDVFCHLTRGEL